jgi:alkylglycerol monooxygenase
MLENFYAWYVLGSVSCFLIVGTTEWWVARRRGQSRYELKNSMTSIKILSLTYLTNFFIGALLYHYLSFFTRFSLTAIGPSPRDAIGAYFSLSFLALLVVDDLLYYLHHRLQHKLRWYWRIHAVHHSSPVFNTLVTARFSPLDLSTLTLWPLLVILGFDPLIVLVVHSLNTSWNIFIHNDLGSLGPLEWVFMTPAHHRVHHSAEDDHTGKNLGGALIIWDKMFGAFAN